MGADSSLTSKERACEFCNKEVHADTVHLCDSPVLREQVERLTSATRTDIPPTDIRYWQVLCDRYNERNERLRAALASIGEYDCPGGVSPKHCIGCAACDANNALSGDSFAPETSAPPPECPACLAGREHDAPCQSVKKSRPETPAGRYQDHLLKVINTAAFVGPLPAEFQALQDAIDEAEAFVERDHSLPVETPDQRRFSGPGELERTGYISPAATPQCIYRSGCKNHAVCYTSGRCVPGGDEKTPVGSAAGASLIVSAEEAKQPMVFRHWSKDPIVPYRGCHCATCSAVNGSANVTISNKRGE